MSFTPQELKLIERLRKEDRRWVWARRVILAIAAFGVCIGTWMALKLISGVESGMFGAYAAIFVAIFYPQCLIVLFTAAALIGLVIRDWYGNVTRMLLLKSLDDRLKEGSKDNPAA